MSNAEDRRTEIALFRYTLILPFLRDEYPPGGKQRLREQIASRHYDVPNSSRSTVSPSTLARWERIYRQDGFDGLKPKRRSDRGQSRAISEETLDRAETLKREQPHRSARSIIKILSLDQTNPIPEERIAPRTLRRHLARRDATTAQLLDEQRPKPYRRFERNHFGDLWQGDAMHGPYLPDPANPGQERQVFLFAFIDDHSRLVPHAQFCRVESWRAHLRVRWFLHTFRVVLNPAPIVTFPAPASSNPTYGFPVLGCPIGFFAKGYVTYQAGSAFGS